MARHRGPRGRNWNVIYIVAGLAAVAVVIGLIYGIGPFGANGGGASGEPNDANGIVVDPPEGNDIGFGPPKRIVKIEPDANSVRIEPVPDVKTDPKATELIAEAMTLLTATPSRIIEARDILNETLKMPMSRQQRSDVKAQLSELADEWLFAKTFYAQDQLCSSYEVQRGDRLETIGKKFSVPYELLMEINKISRPKLLQAGERIKVVNGPFHVKVYRSTFTMDVSLQGTYVRSYPVGLGAPGRQTPLGLWHIKAGGKIPHAIYNDPDTHEVIHPEDPAYPLGSRWMALEGLDENTREETSFGIHGTKEPESIGKAGSRGCIRLHNGDVIKVYDMLVAVKSLIKVLE